MLFTNKRSDGKLVRSLSPYARLMPFILKGRNASAAYYPLELDITETLSYIQKRRAEGMQLGLFSLVLAAVCRTVAERPHLNRFISAGRIYERNIFDIAYTVKRRLTDDAGDSVARMAFAPDATLDTVAQAVASGTQSLKGGGEAREDNLLRVFCNLPAPIIRLCISFLRFLDRHNGLPRAIMNDVPMFASVFAANLGSIGADAPFHHLYEFGTTSIFFTIGRIQKTEDASDEGKPASRSSIRIAFTVDERICDGFYMVRSLQLFESLLRNPAQLESAPAAR